MANTERKKIVDHQRRLEHQYRDLTKQCWIYLGWLVLCLFPTVWIVDHYRGLADLARRYEQAPACATAEEGDCRRQVDIVVTKLWIIDRSRGDDDYMVSVQLPEGRIADYEVRRGFYERLQVGTRVQGEYWAGEIRAMTYDGSYATTDEYPPDHANGMLILACPAVGVSLGLLGWVMWIWIDLRRVARDLAAVVIPPAPPPMPKRRRVAAAPAPSGPATRRLRAQDVPRTLQLTPPHNEARTRRLGATPPLPRRVVR